MTDVGPAGHPEAHQSFPIPIPAGSSEDEKDDDEEEGDRPPKFSEVHRLAYAVGQIDAATSLVPRGAFIVDALHNVRANASFSGLTPAQAGSLENYFHWRQPFALERKTALERAGLVQGVDFLDPASEDSVKGKARHPSFQQPPFLQPHFVYANAGRRRRCVLPIRCLGCAC